MVIKESPANAIKFQTFNGKHDSTDHYATPKAFMNITENNKSSSPNSNVIYTNKLPPVPRRNLKTTAQNTSNNKNKLRYPSLATNKLHSTHEDGMNVKYYKEPSSSSSLERNIYGNLAKYSPQFDNNRPNY